MCLGVCCGVGSSTGHNFSFIMTAGLSVVRCPTTIPFDFSLALSLARLSLASRELARTRFLAWSSRYPAPRTAMKQFFKKYRTVKYHGTVPACCCMRMMLACVMATFQCVVGEIIMSHHHPSLNLKLLLLFGNVASEFR